MNFIKYCILFLLSGLLITCNSSKIENKLRTCVNQEIIETYGIIDEEFDYYNFISEVEEAIIDLGIVSSISSESYIMLIKEISKNSDTLKFEKLNNKIKQLYSQYHMFNAFNELYCVCVDCPFKIVVQEKSDINSSLLFQVQYGNQLEKKDFFDKNIIIEQIENIEYNNDFDKIEYRVPIDLYIMHELERKYSKSR